MQQSLRDIALAEAALGQPLGLRVGAAAAPPEGEAVAELTLSPLGVGLRPFFPVHLTQPGRRGRLPGDPEIGWIRRSSALAADGWEAPEVPLAEEVERCFLDILDSAAIRRSLESTEPRATYTAAQQTADWGAPPGPGDTLDVRVSQFSAIVGWGPAPAVTLRF